MSWCIKTSISWGAKKLKAHDLLGIQYFFGWGFPRIDSPNLP